MKRFFLLLACSACSAVFFSASAQHLAVGFMPFEYEKGAYEMQPIFESVLDKVCEVLEIEPTYMVLIEGHADIDEGAAEENEALSLKRAQAVEKYLVGKGVDLPRLRAIAYGDKLMLKECSAENPCTEEEHAKNRRVALVVKENPYFVAPDEEPQTLEAE
ncbi:MAG: OmpA family protein [Prevotellaceae bacterium]|jgi:outer membrane protein OmpA-like peptidoglycan-associated protein|nr:OmpA family protein [Prevotellaceae bacterium]